MMRPAVKTEKKSQLNLWQSLLLMAFVSGVVWLLIGLMGVSTYGWIHYFRQSWHRPLLFMLNIGPIAMMMLLLFFISKHAIFSATVTSVIFLLLAYINRVKTITRTDPFLPADLTLIRETFALVGEYALSSVIMVTVGFVAAVLFIVFCFKKWKRTVLPLYAQIGGVLFVLLSSFAAFQTVYSDEGIYLSFEGGGYLPANNYAHRGFVYHFIFDIRFLATPTPPNYDRREILALENQNVPSLPEDAVRPHIVIVQGESFSDIPFHGPFDFSGSVHPLENFERIREEAVVSGHVIVDTFGAGTIRPELSVLTGISFADLPIAAPNMYFRNYRDSLAWQLRELGYVARAMHPGNYWFYNRYHVYRFLGFQEFLSVETHWNPAEQNRGGPFISEEATFDVLLENIDHHLAHYEEPLFQFVVTIQNHGPYRGKFPPDYRTMEFDIDVELTDEEFDTLANYLYGLLDQDVQMARLVAHLEAKEEPFVLVYYSDHNPQLFRNNEILGATDPYEMFIARHRVPYFIWANTAALEQTDILQNAAQADIRSDIPYSVFHLMPMMMELLGFHEQVPFYSFIVDLRSIAPVINSKNMDGFYMDPEGNFSREPFEGTVEMLELYRRWSYFKLQEYLRRSVHVQVMGE